MIKYIVTWAIAIVIQDACPDAGRKDQYGREANPGYSCLVYHSHTEFKDQKREFYNRDSAFTFYKEAAKQEPDSNSVITMWSNNLYSVKIDSVKLSTVIEGTPVLKTGTKSKKKA